MGCIGSLCIILDPLTDTTMLFLGPKLFPKSPLITLPKGYTYSYSLELYSLVRQVLRRDSMPTFSEVPKYSSRRSISSNIVMQTSTVVLRSRWLGNRELSFEWSPQKTLIYLRRGLGFHERSMERSAGDFGDFALESSVVTGKDTWTSAVKSNGWNGDGK